MVSSLKIESSQQHSHASHSQRRLHRSLSLACSRALGEASLDGGHAGRHTEEARYVDLVHRHRVQFTSQSLGSVQDVPGIPAKVKEIFLTAWELDQMAVVDLAADRAPFIDQTQSMSLNIANPSADLLVCRQSSDRKTLR